MATVYNRLSFEQIGGNDSDRITRVHKGLLREVVTPFLSVPFSTEGTNVHRYVDRNDIIAGVQMRNEVAAMIVDNYPVVEFKGAPIAYATDLSAIVQTVNVDFIRDAEPVAPGTYI